MNDAAIAGAFAALTVSASKPVTATKQIGDAIKSRPHSAPLVKDARDEAHDEYTARLRDAWKN
jgi:hypothetical protein